MAPVTSTLLPPAASPSRVMLDLSVSVPVMEAARMLVLAPARSVTVIEVRVFPVALIWFSPPPSLKLVLLAEPVTMISVSPVVAPEESMVAPSRTLTWYEAVPVLVMVLFFATSAMRLLVPSPKVMSLSKVVTLTPALSPRRVTLPPLMLVATRSVDFAAAPPSVIVTPLKDAPEASIVLSPRPTLIVPPLILPRTRT